MPTTPWARFLVAERLAAGRTQDEVFDAIRGPMGWSETSRSAYINLEHGPAQGGRDPNADEQRILSELYGGRMPDFNPPEAPLSLEERAVRAAELQAALMIRQVAALEAIAAHLTGSPRPDPTAVSETEAWAIERLAAMRVPTPGLLPG